MRNRGELAEGWFDSATLQKAKASAAAVDRDSRIQQRRQASFMMNNDEDQHASSDDDELGPSLPSKSMQTSRKGQKSGPAIPNTQDLDMQHGMPLHCVSLVPRVLT